MTPVIPILRTHASRVCATVAYAATTFDPAMAVASATTWASFERAMTQPAAAAPNTRHRLTSRDTATETVVKPPSSLKKSEMPK